MADLLGKLIPPFLFPPGLPFALVALGLCLLHWRRRTGYTLIGVGAFVMYASSIALFVDPLVSWLEDKHPQIRVADAPNVEAIVVLGDFVQTQTRLRSPFKLETNTDRLYKGALLYRAGKAPLILLASGTPFNPIYPIETQVESARTMLLQWGIPASAILTEGQSQNTHENAVFSRRLLPADHRPKVLLVTSATHLVRSTLIFQHEGYDVTPFPADYHVGWFEPTFPKILLPNAYHLTDLDAALHEYLGLAVYKARGWI